MHTDTGQAPLLLRLPDAARRLSVSRSTVYNLIGKGALRVVRIGRAVRVPASEIDLWLARHYEAAHD